MSSWPCALHPRFALDGVRRSPVRAFGSVAFRGAWPSGRAPPGSIGSRGKVALCSSPPFRPGVSRWSVGWVPLRSDSLRTQPHPHDSPRNRDSDFVSARFGLHVWLGPPGFAPLVVSSPPQVSWAGRQGLAVRNPPKAGAGFSWSRPTSNGAYAPGSTQSHPSGCHHFDPVCLPRGTLLALAPRCVRPGAQCTGRLTDPWVKPAGPRAG